MLPLSLMHEGDDAAPESEIITEVYYGQTKEETDQRAAADTESTPDQTRDGKRQSFTITETATQFAIDWQANYQIEGNQFIVLEKSGQTRTIIGYPLRDIKRYIRQVMRRK